MRGRRCISSNRPKPLRRACSRLFVSMTRRCFPEASSACVTRVRCQRCHRPRFDCLPFNACPCAFIIRRNWHLVIGGCRRLSTNLICLTFTPTEPTLAIGCNSGPTLHLLPRHRCCPWSATLWTAILRKSLGPVAHKVNRPSLSAPVLLNQVVPVLILQHLSQYQALSLPSNHQRLKSTSLWQVCVCCGVDRMFCAVLRMCVVLCGRIITCAWPRRVQNACDSKASWSTPQERHGTGCATGVRSG